jgi:hypothetical protein
VVRAKTIDRAEQKAYHGRSAIGHRIVVEGGTTRTVHGVERLVLVGTPPYLRHRCRGGNVGAENVRLVVDGGSSINIVVVK